MTAAGPGTDEAAAAATSRPVGRVPFGVAMGVLYFATAIAGLQLADIDGDVTLFWLPTGIAVAAFVVGGPWMALSVAVPVVAYQAWLGVPAPTLAAFVVGNAAGPYVASRLLARAGFDPALRGTRDFVLLGASALAGMLVPATAGVAALAAAGALSPERAGAAWLGWYAGDVLGVLLGAPLVLSVRERLRARRAGERRPRVEPLAWLSVAVLLAAGIALSLVTHAPYEPQGIVAMFVLQLAVAAAAAWLDLAGAWIALLAVGLAVTVPALMGAGPFVRASVAEGHWVAWLFLVLATAFAVLSFAARRRLESVQQALKVRERQLTAMFEQAAAGLSVTERGRYVMVNDAFCEMVGYPRDVLVGRHGADITHPDDRHLHAAALRRWAAGAPGGIVFEKRYLHRDGRIVWARVALSVVPPVRGEVPQVVALKLDITGHKRVEASLRRQREQLALVFESTGSGIWDHDLVADRPFFSDSYLRILGYPPGTRFKRLALELHRLHPDDRSRFLAEESAMFDRRVPLDIEFRLRKADGSYLWVHARGFATWNDAGCAIRSYGAIADVSARKAAEAALVDSRARLSAVIDSALDAILAIDEVGRVVLFNPAAETLFGRPAADVLGLSVLQLVPPRLRGDALERLLGTPAALHTAPGQAGRSTMQVLHADRTEFTVDASIATVTVDAGRLATIVMRDARIRQRLDAAERARAEAEAASRAKTDFLSRMSHELRTPLNAVLGFAQLMELDADAPLLPAQRERIRAIREAGGHLGALIDELLDLTRIESDRLRLEREDLDLGAVGRQCARLVSLAAAEAGVRLDVDLDEARVLPIVGDPTRLRQVLVNLLSNAIKYNRRGGSVRVRGGATLDGAAWIEVADDGPGIAADDQARLFEPFERLGREHGPIEGSGIGLALSRRLVELMGGRIEVDSAPGRGSVFRVRLPSARPRPSATAPGSPGRPASAGERRVPDRA